MHQVKEVHAAVIETAKMLEEEPWRYRFLHGHMADVAMSGRACALVWIGHFLGHDPHFIYAKDVAKVVMLVSHAPFLGTLAEDKFYHAMRLYSDSAWFTHAYKVAAALRTFAARELA